MTDHKGPKKNLQDYLNKASDMPVPSDADGIKDILRRSGSHAGGRQSSMNRTNLKIPIMITAITSLGLGTFLLLPSGPSAEKPKQDLSPSAAAALPVTSGPSPDIKQPDTLRKVLNKSATPQTYVLSNGTKIILFNNSADSATTAALLESWTQNGGLANGLWRTGTNFDSLAANFPKWNTDYRNFGQVWKSSDSLAAALPKWNNDYKQLNQVWKSADSFSSSRFMSDLNSILNRANLAKERADSLIAELKAKPGLLGVLPQWIRMTDKEIMVSDDRITLFIPVTGEKVTAKPAAENKPIQLTEKQLKKLGITVREDGVYYKNIIKGLGALKFYSRNKGYSADGLGRMRWLKWTTNDFYPVYFTDLQGKQPHKFFDTVTVNAKLTDISFARQCASLVPVMVPKPGAEGSDWDGIIFWFNPTPSLKKALPQIEDFADPKKDVIMLHPDSGALTVRNNPQSDQNANNPFVQDGQPLLYPNPATDYAFLQMRLDKSYPVTISLHGMDGKKISTLHQGTLPAGENRLNLKWADVAPGQYIVLIQIGQHYTTGRQLLIIAP